MDTPRLCLAGARGVHGKSGGASRSADEIVWVKGTDLREKIRSLLGQSTDEMGNAQWIGHILKRLQLIDQSRRKHHVGGKLYAIERARRAHVFIGSANATRAAFRILSLS